MSIFLRSFNICRNKLPSSPQRVYFSPKLFLPASNQRTCLSTSVICRNAETSDRERKDRIVTIPNLLCVSRIAAAPYISHLIINGNFPMACGVFMYAGATDFLDGYIARNFKNQASSLGSFLDPLSDKILVGMKMFKGIHCH